MQKGFTTSEVEQLTGVSARKLRWWDERGLVTPSKSPNRKRSKTRRYNLQDIICILVIDNLRQKGLSLHRIGQAIKHTKKAGIKNPLANLRVACLASNLFFKEDGQFYEPITGQVAIKEALEVIRPKLDPTRYSSTQKIVRKAQTYYERKVSVL